MIGDILIKKEFISFQKELQKIRVHEKLIVIVLIIITDLLGNKGANLCEMYRLGLPVPPGFIITAETCLDFFDQKRESSNLAQTLINQYNIINVHIIIIKFINYCY